MDTHEHNIPDEDLPGHGVLDADFEREMLRRKEELGLILWDDESETYEPSARMVMGVIGALVLAKSQEIDLRAGQAQIMQQIMECIPWVGNTTIQEVSVELPDTFPADWLGEHDAS